MNYVRLRRACARRKGAYLDLQMALVSRALQDGNRDWREKLQNRITDQNNQQCHVFGRCLQHRLSNSMVHLRRATRMNASSCSTRTRATAQCKFATTNQRASPSPRARCQRCETLLLHDWITCPLTLMPCRYAPMVTWLHRFSGYSKMSPRVARCGPPVWRKISDLNTIPMNAMGLQIVWLFQDKPARCALHMTRTRAVQP